jgi:hypothetical protein
MEGDTFFKGIGTCSTSSSYRASGISQHSQTLNFRQILSVQSQVLGQWNPRKPTTSDSKNTSPLNLSTMSFTQMVQSRGKNF